MKKVLITGGAGYLGSVLTEVLLNNGYNVTIIDNLLYKQTSVAPFTYNKNFNFILGDVTDNTLLKKLVEENDVIIPLAAIVGMPACKSQPELTIKINYEQVKNITKWATKNQMILIPNTNSQYGSSTEIITEDSPFKPLSLYAETKCDAEKSVLDSGNGIALRLATVFGMSYRMRTDLLVNDFVYKAMTDGYLVLFESHFIRNYIHIRDIANTFLFMIHNYEKCNNNAYNVGLTTANCTKLELAQKIQKFIPDLVIVENNFKQDFDQRNYMVSNSKLESLGWLPNFTLEDGINELISGYNLINKFKNKDFTNL
ncbi:MAG: NAD(P)-dependent oxidoreductase [Proteobacteria bacterium]|jgi:nucleoside-diphosphate-sugar epimerase|nr:NAD(P)-dependent oxidoreductase [Pseudomonadota bacterium]